MVGFVNFTLLLLTKSSILILPYQQTGNSKKDPTKKRKNSINSTEAWNDLLLSAMSKCSNIYISILRAAERSKHLSYVHLFRLRHINIYLLNISFRSNEWRKRKVLQNKNLQFSLLPCVFFKKESWPKNHNKNWKFNIEIEKFLIQQTSLSSHLM